MKIELLVSLLSLIIAIFAVYRSTILSYRTYHVDFLILYDESQIKLRKILEKSSNLNELLEDARYKKQELRSEYYSEKEHIIRHNIFMRFKDLEDSYLDYLKLFINKNEHKLDVKYIKNENELLKILNSIVEIPYVVLRDFNSVQYLLYLDYITLFQESETYFPIRINKKNMYEKELFKNGFSRKPVQFNIYKNNRRIKYLNAKVKFKLGIRNSIFPTR